VSTAGEQPKVREVLPGFHLLHLPLPMRPTIVNVYLVDGGRGEWALIDTGMGTAESLAAFDTALELVGCPPRSIRKIISTHHHPDHYGSSAPHREKSGAEVFLHPLEAERMSFYLPRPRPPEALKFFERHGFPMSIFDDIPPPSQFWAGMYKVVEPDHPLGDGDSIRIGEREARIVWTPGHSPGHCVVHFPKEKVLIVGDHLLPKITPHIGITSEDPQDPLGDFIASLRKVGELDVETVLPAHGAVYHDHRHRVRQLIEFHDYRLDVILDIVRGRPRTAYDAALEAFGLTGESPFQQQFPATFETLAHLERLRRGGRVERREIGTHVVWAPRPVT
jgi:glyoxylase-like metal-dependent hydrolase (beta-lactamase superfamily II)